MADRLRIYIASPISQGDLCDNINKAPSCFHRLRKAGLAPFCPSWSAFSGGCDWNHDGKLVAEAGTLPDGTAHADWMAVDLPWVSAAEAVLRLPGPSVGADAEVAHAEAQGIPVFTSEADLLTWVQEIRY